MSPSAWHFADKVQALLSRAAACARTVTDGKSPSDGSAANPVDGRMRRWMGRAIVNGATLAEAKVAELRGPIGNVIDKLQSALREVSGRSLDASASLGASQPGDAADVVQKPLVAAGSQPSASLRRRRPRRRKKSTAHVAAKDLG